MSSIHTVSAPRSNRAILEIGVAVLAFVVFAIAVLTRTTALLEPDDYAYRASIEALLQGHLTLSSAEYQSLAHQLGGIQQWTKLPDGAWISEKNPGYPFLALPFAAIGALRIAPLFYGALGCIGVFIGARRWLGEWMGAYAVMAFLASGAALVFAWRDTMPTFSDASLIAAGSGALVWTLLARERTQTLRMIIGLLASAAVTCRYTNAVILAVAVVATLIALRPAGISRKTACSWGSLLVVIAIVVLAFNWMVYGAPQRTGYASGEITFSLASVWPNLTHMPQHLWKDIPGSIVAAVGIGWALVRLLRLRDSELTPHDRRAVLRDAAIAGALAAAWIALWALYSAYDWTAMMNGGIHPGGAGRLGGAGGMPQGMPQGGGIPPDFSQGGPPPGMPFGGSGTPPDLSQGGPPPGMPLGGNGAPPIGGGIGAGPGGDGQGVHVIRFYVPAIGPIALLAAYTLSRLPRWAPPIVIAVLIALATWTYPDLAGSGAMPGGGRVPGGAGLPGFGSPTPTGTESSP